MSMVGKRLIGAAKQARKIAAGEIVAAKTYVPAEIDVKAIRGKIGLGQDQFASEFGFTLTQIRDWEQNRHRPLGALRAYLMLIDLHPDTIRKILREACEAMEGNMEESQAIEA